MLQVRAHRCPRYLLGATAFRQDRQCREPAGPGTGSRLTAAIIGRIEHPRGTVLELRNLTHNVLPSGPW